MQVNKTFKGNKGIVQEGFKAIRMENPKENESPMKETMI